MPSRISPAARAGHVRWRCAILFAAIGAVGAALGSMLGKAFDSRRLIFLFAVLMIVIGLLMLQRSRRPAALDAGRAGAGGASPLMGVSALGVGMLSGFFGIGGGFLIVPGLLFSTGMPMIDAVGSSLLAVGSFGLTTATSYALSGLVDWTVAAEYIAGGLLGGLAGMNLACHLAARRAVLTQVFAALIFVVAGYMLYRTATAPII
jgi:uncharacterized protein